MKNIFIALFSLALLAVSSVAFAAECPLCDAATEGNVLEIKRLLGNGAYVNDTDEDGHTALMLAARKGQNEVMQVLLDNGANVNYQSKNGTTALMEAVWIGYIETTKLLLENGANVNITSKIVNTALILAVARGHSKVVKLLLENRANVNYEYRDKNEKIWTALMDTARDGHSELAKLLLENGANVNYQNNEGETALMEAAFSGHGELAKLLLVSGANVDEANIIGETALKKSAFFGHGELAKLLLENGANVNYKDKYGDTALMRALTSDHANAEYIRILLQCGANPDIKNNFGSNAWDYAKKYTKGKRAVLATLEKHLNDVVAGRKFPPCNKIATNKQNPTQPDVVGGIETDKLPKEHNIAERVFENTWRSVVYVDTYDSQGSGVIIRPNVVATNCHVVESANNIQIYKAEERRTNRDVSYNATIIKQDEENDFCLLSVEGLWGVAATIRKYNTLNIGEDVYGLGAPQGFDLSLSTGVVSQLRKEDGARLIQTDTAISPGSSGGGLFDSEGNLIGILTKKIVDDDVEGIGFAIPADLAL